MPKRSDPVAPDSPPVEKDEEEDSGGSFSDEEEEENKVSEPEPPQKKHSQVKKKPGAVAQSGQQQPSETPSASSKKPFDRLWSEEDEIVILKGMIDYRAKKKVNPKSDLDGFFEFIKNSIRVDVTKTQLHNKIRTLKRKYDNCNKKASLKKGHEQIAFNLLKKIWGTEADDVDHNSPAETNRVAVKKSSDRAVKNAVKESKDDVVVVQRAAKRSRPNEENRMSTYMLGVGDLGVESWVERVVMPSFKREKRREMEQKWKELKRQEVEIVVKRTELLLRQAKIILKSSSN